MQLRAAARNEKSEDTATGERQGWHPRVAVETSGRLAAILRRQSAWRWVAVLLCVIILHPLPVLAEDEISPDRMQTGSLLLRMQSGYVIATRMNTDIDATISGLAARVRVKQSFLNDGSEWVEGVYVFPLPDGAAVDSLRMTIGDRIIEGEIREKEKAKKEYQQAKAAGKKASLVEQQRPNMFTTSVANIAPGETIQVEIEYLETLHYDAGNFSLRFPLTMTPRYIPGSSVPGRQGSGWSADTDQVPDASLITPPVVTKSKDHRVRFHAEIDAGLPLSYIASRYHPVSIKSQGNDYTVDFADRNVPMDHDIELTWKPIGDRMPRAMLFTETVENEPHVLLMMLPPDIATEAGPVIPRELIFVIDTSGSMHGTSLQQAQRALTLALDGLRPVDQFNIIQFNSSTSVLFPGSVAASSQNISVAKRYVTALKASGGTEMYPAISQALSTPAFESHLRQVIFITDGSVGNEETLYQLIEQKLGNTRLFTVGIGSAPNSWFMRKAAEAGRGTFTMISALHEVREKMGRLFDKVETPQLTDISVQWPSGNDVVAYPENVADLYAGEPVLVKARLSAETRSGDLITISGNSANGSWEAELPVEIGEGAPGIAAMWARAKIESLLDDARRSGKPDSVRDEVTATALRHHLVSKYTSLVAVDKTPARPRGTFLSREQVPSLLPYGQNMQAIFGITPTATPAAMQRVTGLAMIMLALMMFVRFRKGRRHATSA